MKIEKYMLKAKHREKMKRSDDMTREERRNVAGNDDADTNI